MNALLELLSRSVTWPFWPVVLAKAAVPLLAAALLTLTLRRRSAATRHLVWISGLVGALAVPLLTLFAPFWSLTMPVAVHHSFVRSPDVPPALDRRVFDSGMEHSSLNYDRSGPIGLRKTATAKIEPTQTFRATLDPARWLTILWAVGALMALLPLVAGMVRLAFAARRATPVIDTGCRELATSLARSLGLRRTICLLHAGPRAMPMTWGWMRPVVLLPEDFGSWTEERKRIVLLHELGHVKRLDCLTQQFAQVVLALYWFNPLAWLAAHRLRIERERACDDLVLLAGSRPSDYAIHLLALARLLNPPGIAANAAVTMARRSQLGDRIVSILDARSRRCASRRRAALWCLTGLLALVIPLSTIRLQASDDPKQVAPSNPSADSDKMTVAGVVLDPAGKRVAGARVAVMAKRKRTTLDRETPRQPDVLAATKSNREGQYTVTLPRISSLRYWQPTVLAGAPDFGIGGVSFDPHSAKLELTISLVPERVLRGRLVDLKGQGLAGVEVRVESISTSVAPKFEGFSDEEPATPGALWPAPATTDAEGRFTIRQLGTNQRIQLAIRDDRYARQDFDLAANAPRADAEQTFSLGPPQILVIRIVEANGGKAIPGAKVLVASYQKDGKSQRSLGSIELEADARGLLVAHPIPGDHFVIAAYPPGGQPYLLRSKEVAWPKGALRHEVELALRTSVLVRGYISEAASLMPVSGARVFYIQSRINNPFYKKDAHSPWFGWGPDTATGPDGRFALAVPPGEGHLLIQGSPDFIHVATSELDLKTGSEPNRRLYPDALVKLNLKPEVETHDVEIKLRRGTTVTGRVLDPDGKPVTEAVVFCRSYVPFVYPSSESGYSGQTIPVRDGRFELTGLDPEQTIPVFFFDVKNALGAIVELSGKSAAKGPVTVQLKKCGSATLRLVDKQGKPIAGATPSAEIIVTPGAQFYVGEGNELVADTVFQANLDRKRTRELVADAQGRFTLSALIPGATYMLWSSHRNGRMNASDRRFTVVAGETIDLADVTVNVP